MPTQRAAMADGNTMVGHFAVVFDLVDRDPIDVRRQLPRADRAGGAFAATFKAKRDQIRVLYDHGADPTIGNKPLGTPSVLREDKAGAYYEVPLFTTPYVNDLKPRSAGALGASFRFKVTGEEW
jgi:phage head maturation protease